MPRMITIEAQPTPVKPVEPVQPVKPVKTITPKKPAAPRRPAAPKKSVPAKPLITCDKAAFLATLNRAMLFVAGRAPLPITKSVRLTVEDNLLVIRATDLDSGIHSVLDIGATAPFDTVVPPKQLKETIAKMHGETVTLEITDEGRRLHIEDGTRSMDILTSKAADFPPIPDFELRDCLGIPAETFTELVRGTAFAASDDDTRPILVGVLVEWTGQVLRMTATNGFRLATMERPLDSYVDPFIVVVPATALQKWAKIAEKVVQFKPVRITDKDGKTTGIKHLSLAAVGWGGIQRVLEGTYPNYRQIIPEKFVARMQVQPGELTEGIKLLGAAVSKKKDAIMTLQLDGTARLMMADAEVGSAACELEAACSGTPSRVSFNPGYLQDAIKAVAGITAPQAPPVSAKQRKEDEPVVQVGSYQAPAGKDAFKSVFASAQFRLNAARRLHGPDSREAQEAEVEVQAVRDARDRGEFSRTPMPPAPKPQRHPAPVQSSEKVLLEVALTGPNSAATVRRLDDAATVHVVMPMHVPGSR